MVFTLQDRSKAAPLFAGWQETLITSCLQGVMGQIFVTDLEHPTAAFAFIGCFGFFAGEPNRELVQHKPAGFVIFTPQNEAWAALLEEVYPSAHRTTRYAIRKNTVFDRDKLREAVRQLPQGYELKPIDADLYEQCLQNPVTADFVSVFETKERYLSLGRGMVILKDGQIVSGASSYTRYREGIEIEVDTIESERRKHLATVVCAALILRCLEEGLYPSWDAQNQNSVRLAETLGYEFDHEYPVYEVASSERTH